MSELEFLRKKAALKRLEELSQPQQPEETSLVDDVVSGAKFLGNASQGLINQVPEMLAIPFQADKALDGANKALLTGGAALLSEQFPSQAENINKAVSTALRFGNAQDKMRDSALDYVEKLPDKRLIPEGEDKRADAAYTAMNWLNPNAFAKGVTAMDRVFDVATPTAAAAGEFFKGDVGELAGGLGVTAVDMLRSFKPMKAVDAASETAKNLYSSMLRGEAPTDANPDYFNMRSTDNQAEQFLDNVNAPENSGKRLDDLVQNPEVQEARQIVAREIEEKRVDNALTAFNKQKEKVRLEGGKDVLDTLNVNNTAESLSPEFRDAGDKVAEEVSKNVTANLKDIRKQALLDDPDSVKKLEEGEQASLNDDIKNINVETAEALREADKKQAKSLADAEEANVKGQKAIAKQKDEKILDATVAHERTVAEINKKTGITVAEKEAEIAKANQYLKADISKFEAEYVEGIKQLRAEKKQTVDDLVSNAEATDSAELKAAEADEVAAKKAAQANAKVEAKTDTDILNEEISELMKTEYANKTDEAKGFYTDYENTEEAQRVIPKTFKPASAVLNSIRNGKGASAVLNSVKKDYPDIHAYIENPQLVKETTPNDLNAVLREAKKRYRSKANGVNGAEYHDLQAKKAIDALEATVEKGSDSQGLLKKGREAYAKVKNRFGVSGKSTPLGKKFLEAKKPNAERSATFLSKEMLKGDEGVNTLKEFENLGMSDVDEKVGEYLKKIAANEKNPEKFLEDYKPILDRKYPELKSDMEKAIGANTEAKSVRQVYDEAVAKNQSAIENVNEGIPAARKGAVAARKTASEVKEKGITDAKVSADKVIEAKEKDIEKAKKAQADELEKAQIKQSDANEKAEKQAKKQQSKLAENTSKKEKTAREVLEAAYTKAEKSAETAKVAARKKSAERLADQVSKLADSKTLTSAARAERAIKDTTAIFASSDARKVVDDLLSEPDNVDNLNIIKAAAEKVGAGDEFKQLIGRTLANKVLTKDKATGEDIVDTDSFSKMNETLNNLEKADIYKAGEDKELIKRLRASYMKLSETQQGIEKLKKQAESTFSLKRELLPAIGAWGILRGLNVNSLMLTGVVKRSLRHFIFDKNSNKKTEQMNALVDFMLDPKGLIPYFDKLGKDISQRRLRRAADAYFAGVKIEDFDSEEGK